MKVPVVVLLAVLGLSLARGKIAHKCDLGGQLLKAMGGDPKDLKGNNLVATLVCRAEQVSALNTEEQGGHGPAQTTANPRRARQVPNFFGFFQFSNKVACSDGVTPSLNICNTDCSRLLKGSPFDQLNCQKKVKSSGKRSIAGDECSEVEASSYFAEC